MTASRSGSERPSRSTDQAMTLSDGAGVVAPVVDWVMKSDFEAIKKNLFPASHAAISDWNKFPWHRDRHGVIQTYKPASSQALAIDVFGTIKVTPDRGKKRRVARQDRARPTAH